MKILYGLPLLILITNFACGFKYEEMPVKVQDAVTVCKDTMGITHQELEQMMSANDSQIGCLYACVLKKLEAMDGNGMLDVAKIESLAKEFKDPEMADDFAMRLALHCTEDVKSDEDECKVASTFMNCMSDKDHVI